MVDGDRPPARSRSTIEGSASYVWYPPRCMSTIEPRPAPPTTLAAMAEAVGPPSLIGRQWWDRTSAGLR